MTRSTKYYTAKIDRDFEVHGVTFSVVGFITQPLSVDGEYLGPEYCLEYVGIVNDHGQTRLPDAILDSGLPEGAVPGKCRYTWRFAIEAEIFQYVEKHCLWVEEYGDPSDYYEEYYA